MNVADVISTDFDSFARGKNKTRSHLPFRERPSIYTVLHKNHLLGLVSHPGLLCHTLSHFQVAHATSPTDIYVHKSQTTPPRKIKQIPSRYNGKRGAPSLQSNRTYTSLVRASRTTRKCFDDSTRALPTKVSLCTQSPGRDYALWTQSAIGSGGGRDPGGLSFPKRDQMACSVPRVCVSRMENRPKRERDCDDLASGFESSRTRHGRIGGV